MEHGGDEPDKKRYKVTIEEEEEEKEEGEGGSESGSDLGDEMGYPNQEEVESERVSCTTFPLPS